MFGDDGKLNLNAAISELFFNHLPQAKEDRGENFSPENYVFGTETEFVHLSDDDIYAEYYARIDSTSTGANLKQIYGIHPESTGPKGQMFEQDPDSVNPDLLNTEEFEIKIDDDNNDRIIENVNIFRSQLLDTNSDGVLEYVTERLSGVPGKLMYESSVNFYDTTNLDGQGRAMSSDERGSELDHSIYTKNVFEQHVVDFLNDEILGKK